ncbi:MAG: hypothetical protein HQM15_06195 [Deltaproteobacteria bacterium]|nr:hypothetical protein [Deltaproteobacteria bacterium]
MNKIIPLSEIERIRKGHSKETLALCFGHFLQLDFSTLHFLENAKKHCRTLVVLIASQGEGSEEDHAYFPHLRKRAELLALLPCVDYVVLNPLPNAVNAIHKLKPNFFLRHASYRSPTADLSGHFLAEEDALNKIGAKLLFTEDALPESRHILESLGVTWNSRQVEAIREAEKLLDHNKLSQLMEQISNTKVLVVGEPIVDTYVFCEVDSISSKSPSISARYLHEENYPGGSLAIARHLQALGAQVTLLITHGDEPYFENLLRSSVSPEIQLEFEVIPNVPTPRKTRFVVPFKHQRIFEITHLRSDQWKNHSPSNFCKKLQKLSREQEVTLISDFGHGLFEGQVLQSTKKLSSFVGLNVQTNSGNFGFNPFTKHQHYNYLSIDERECRVATHDRLTPIRELAHNTIKTKIKRPAAITLGSSGSMFFDSRHREHFCPVFFKDGIDTTGAGDAYFALTTLLVHLETHPDLIPFLGNIYAGLKTRIVGNKEAVRKENLVATVKAMLESIQ